MTAQELELKVLESIRKDYPNAEKTVKMDITMRDAVMYGAGAAIRDYTLFSQTTNTNKTSGFVRTHTFPLDRGRVFVVYGIRAFAQYKLSAAPSSTAGSNEFNFEHESIFSLKLDKTELNSITLNQTLSSFIESQGGVPVRVPKQNWKGHYFSEPIILPSNGQFSVVFKPTPGYVTVAANAANPFVIEAGSAVEQHQIKVELIAQEWTVEN